MEIPLAAKKYLVPALIIAVVLACALALFFYFQAAALKKSPEEVLRREIEEIVSDISKVMILPEEIPTLATVSDVEKLKDQPFFARAQKGDKVVIYGGAGKAILWRPSSELIVEVSSLSLATPDQKPAAR